MIDHLIKPPDNLGNYSKKEILQFIKNAIAIENEENSNAKIVMITIDELPDYIRQCTEERHRLIVNNDNHFTAIDIQQRPSKSCIILDAANDPRCYVVFTMFNEKQFHTKVTPVMGFKF